MTQPTKGRWYWESDGDKGREAVYVVSPEAGDRICDMLTGSVAQRKANARVVVFGSELEQALRNLVEAVEQDIFFDNPDGPGDWQDKLDFKDRMAEQAKDLLNRVDGWKGVKHESNGT